MDLLKQEKAALRRDVLARRDALDPAVRLAASLAIAETVAAALEFAPGTIVSGFLPIRSELDPQPLMRQLADRGARICVPAIVDAQLEFRELRPHSPLVAQGFGTLAPGPEAAILDPEIMLVPLAAFDARCHRMGYGRGYYDRAIGSLRAKGMTPLLAGLAFAVQEVASVPVEAHDVGLDLVATENRLYRADKRPRGAAANTWVK